MIIQLKDLLTKNKFIRFSIIGGLGYFVDILVLFIAFEVLSFSVYFARLISAIFAATFTWVGNRFFTFSSTKRSNILKEWVDYLYAMIPGAIVNYSIFSFIVYAFGSDRMVLIIAVSLGVLAGLIINYNIARKYVFK